jgi:ribulose-bisphosphate carboxylase large chain
MSRSAPPTTSPEGVDALVYLIDEATEEMRIAYPLDLFDRNITDGRMMIVSFLTLVIGNNQGMGDIQHAKIYDFWMPPRAIQLFDGPSKDISDMWRVLGRPVKDGGYIAGTIIKPKLGLRPEPFAAAAYQFWLGGDFIKNDEPQGNQTFAPMKKTLPLVYDAMKRAMDETARPSCSRPTSPRMTTTRCWRAASSCSAPSAPTPTRWPSWWTVTWAARA